MSRRSTAAGSDPKKDAPRARASTGEVWAVATLVIAAVALVVAVAAAARAADESSGLGLPVGGIVASVLVMAAALASIPAARRHAGKAPIIPPASPSGRRLPVEVTWAASALVIAVIAVAVAASAIARAAAESNSVALPIVATVAAVVVAGVALRAVRQGARPGQAKARTPVAAVALTGTALVWLRTIRAVAMVALVLSLAALLRAIGSGEVGLQGAAVGASLWAVIASGLATADQAGAAE